MVTVEVALISPYSWLFVAYLFISCRFLGFAFAFFPLPFLGFTLEFLSTFRHLRFGFL